MTISHYTEGEIFHVCLQGVLSATSAQDLLITVQTELKAAVSEVWVDCSLLEEVSPSGLEYLILLQHWLQEKQKHMLLIHLNHSIMQLFQPVLLDVTLPVFATKESAYHRHKLSR